jgi:excisionase family DNA binding protein
LPEVGAISAVQGVYDDEQSRLFAQRIPTESAAEQQPRRSLLTADDIAAWLSVPRSSVYEYARRQHEPLPAVRIGRHLRFLHDDVADWIDAQREGRAPAVRTVTATPPSTRTWRRADAPQ